MPSDTFKYIPAMMLPSPGVCVICGSNQRGAIDFGFSAEYYGAVLICEECIGDLANVEELGFIRKAEVAHLMEQNEQLLAREGRSASERVRLRVAMVAAVDTFDTALDNDIPGQLSLFKGQPPEPFNFLETFGSAD